MYAMSPVSTWGGGIAGPSPLTGLWARFGIGVKALTGLAIGERPVQGATAGRGCPAAWTPKIKIEPLKIGRQLPACSAIVPRIMREESLIELVRRKKLIWRKLLLRPSFPIQYLFIRQQPFPQLRIIHFLDARLAIDGEGGGGAGRLAEDHEHRLHADGAV